MESTFGRIISGFLGLLALAAVVVLGYEAMTKSNDAGTVAAIFSLAQNVRGDYANNTAGYGTLSNATVIDAGEAPPAIVKSGALVDPWGNPMSVGAISGNVHAFQVSFGPVPTGDCAQIASDMTSADGIQIGASASPVTPPYDIGALTAACVKANGGPMTLMYGGVKPLSYLSGSLLYTNNGPTGGGFGVGSFDYPSSIPVYLANQWKISNSNTAPTLVTVYLYDYPVNSTPSAKILVNGSLVAPVSSGGGGAYAGYGEQYYSFYVGPGENIISAVQATTGSGMQATSGAVGAASGIGVAQFVQTGTTSQPY